MKLTSERCNGIKTGYWSASKKADLVQKLGMLEWEVSGLLEAVCDKCCKYPFEIKDQEHMTEICDTCPMNSVFIRLGE